MNKSVLSDVHSLVCELDKLKERMLAQVVWEPCDCGCPEKRTPKDKVSVTWLRAVRQLEITLENWSEDV